MIRKKLCFIATVPMTVQAFLSMHLDKLSDNYDVFVVSNLSLGSISYHEKVTYINIPLERKISLFADIVALFSLIKLFRRNRFDAIHSITPKSGLLAMLSGFLAGVPLRIHWFTGQVWVTRKGVIRFILKSADKIIALLATNLLADSPSQRSFLISEGVCSFKAIEVIGDGSVCGVDCVRFRPDSFKRSLVRTQHNIPVDATLILFLGRLNLDKGLRELAEAMVLVDQRFDEIHWLIVGPDEGGMVDLVREIAISLGPRLHFHGFTNEPELFMAASDIFCLPSYREGFGSSVLEAAAVGIPSVASRIYGLTDAVEDGVTGLLVPPFDKNALVGGLSVLLQNPILRKSMGDKARKRAIERFSRARLAEGLLDFYVRILT